MCLIFVFVALLEFALVNVVSRRGIRIRRPPPPPPPPVPHSKDSDSDKRMEQVFSVRSGIAALFSSSASSRPLCAML